MKSIFSYSSVQRYLQDRFQLEKAQGKGVTLAKFASQLGMSGSMFNMIIEGSRKLSVEKAHDIAQAFRMTYEEEEYFEALLLSEQAPAGQMSFYRRRLNRLKKSMSVQRVSTSLNFILSQWYLPALLIYLVDIAELQDHGLSQAQYDAIEQKFRIQRKDIDRAISEFRKAGFLTLKTGEKPHIVFSKLTTKIPQKAFIKSAIQESLRRVETDFENSETAFHSHTFSIHQDTIPELVSEYKALIEKHMASFDSADQTSMVVQTGFQLFPVIKNKW